MHLSVAALAEAEAASTTSSTASSSSFAALAAPLALAQTLHVAASALANHNHRSRYLKEIVDVSGLIAYQNLDESPHGRYLDLGRRRILADGIDRAILRAWPPSCSPCDSPGIDQLHSVDGTGADDNA
jgi:hypothetical protein